LKNAYILLDLQYGKIIEYKAQIKVMSNLQKFEQKNEIEKNQLLTSFELQLTTKSNYKRIAKNYIDFTLKHSLEFNQLSRNSFLSQYSEKSQRTYKTATKKFLEFCSLNGISKATHASVAKSGKIEKNFRNLAQMFLSQIDTNKTATKKSYKDALLSFGKFLETQSLAFFGQKQIIDFRNSFDSPYTSNMYLSAIRNFCKYLIENIDTLLTPKNKGQKELIIFELEKCIKVKNLKVETDGTIIKGVLSIQEIESLLSSIENKQEKLLLAFLAYGGLRTIEVTRLNFNDIVLSENYIKIQGKGKNGKTQTIPILAKLKELLKSISQSDLESSKPIFGYSGAMIRHIVNKHLEANNLKHKENTKVSAHSFRHSLAINLLIKEIPIYTVQKILRHKSLETTQIYIKYLQQREILNSEKLLNVF